MNTINASIITLLLITHSSRLLPPLNPAILPESTASLHPAGTIQPICIHLQRLHRSRSHRLAPLPSHSPPLPRSLPPVILQLQPGRQPSPLPLARILPPSLLHNIPCRLNPTPGPHTRLDPPHAHHLQPRALPRPVQHDPIQTPSVTLHITRILNKHDMCQVTCAKRTIQHHT